jgi:integrase
MQNTNNVRPLRAEATSGKQATFTKERYVPSRPLSDLLLRYRNEICPNKRGCRWEQIRIDRYLRDYPMLFGKQVSEITKADFVELREHRLLSVQSSSVRREFNLLSNILATATYEWEAMLENPLRKFKRPSNSQPRDRLFDSDELTAVLQKLGFKEGITPQTKSSRVGVILLVAIETGMRSSELCRLQWGDVYLKQRVACVGVTKNGDRKRVPLSPRALELLTLMWPLRKEFDGLVFGVSSALRDALFRKARDRAGVENLRFHDSRHQACTQLSQKLDMLPLARMLGIRDPRILMVYYNETAEDVALRLAAFEKAKPTTS